MTRPTSGVALVITLILLAIITFMAVTFLIVSRREKGAVVSTTDQNTSLAAANGGLERAKVEAFARILAFTNEFNIGLMVSTNYVNGLGFNPAAPANPTNVNFWYKLNGSTNFTAAEIEQINASLYYSPPAPVVVSNRFYGSNDFRYYLDLNRNGRFDANGWNPVIAANGQYLNNDGTTSAAVNTNTVYAYFVGDPEWIGILEHPDWPHSASNKFVSRLAFVMVPISQTLDINSVHNYAKRLNPGLAPGVGDGFVRNQGVGTWEMNWAAFLVDLNTNFWPTALSYNYDPPNTANFLNSGNSGTAFDDALSLMRYRYGGNFRLSLKSFANLYGTQPPPGGPPLGVNYVSFDKTSDTYADGPMMFQTSLTNDNDQVNQPFSGAPNTNHLFTMQDLFDRNKTAMGVLPTVDSFPDRLYRAGASNDSYNRFTYYRILEQIGTDSAPGDAGKIHLNFDNRVRANALGVISSTNFYSWQPITFFTNAVNKVLREQGFPFDLTTGIPVYTNGTFVYWPSVHRLMQVAANVYDASTNRADRGGVNYPYLPSVFRPVFEKRGNTVYLRDFVEETGGTNYTTRPRDLDNPSDFNALQPNDNVYGVPWVIGAKKGLPNFNEFAMQSVFQITRKLQVSRTSVSSPRSSFRTNEMFVIGVSNVIGAEVWNSYRSNYTRPVEIIVADDMSIALTNDFGVNLSQRADLARQLVIPSGTNFFWPGWSYRQADRSFMVPLRTNFILLPDSVYLAAANAFAPDVQIRFDDARLGRGFVEPQWGLAVTNRVRVIVRDIQSGRIIDYVQLAGLNGIRDLSGEIRTPDNELGFAGLWSTNRQGGQGINFPPIGVVNQVQISLGNYNASAVDWRDYGVNQPTSPKKEEEIDKFRAFFGLSPLWYPGTVNTNLNAQVPFTPTRKVSQYLTWQANDPLVHYLSGDLQSLDTTNNVRIENLNLPVETLENIGRLNNRYSPWGGNPFLTGGAGDASTDAHANDIAVKDPQVFTSDDWDFPTNFFPNVGALGRIHRGTPWQTVYMKAGNIAATDFPSWKRWTGNNFDGDNDAKRMAPIEDRTLFDVFTAAINENASRGQLSVNQTNFAAWSAVLSGVITLANTNTPDDLVNRQLLRPPPPLQYDPVVIQPMGTNTTGSMARILQAIHDVRATNVYTRAVNGNLQATFGNFQRAGDILNVPELSDASPFLDRSTELHTQYGISDAAYERIPQQIMSLLTLSHEPRFLIYAYGQALRPAERSILTSGPYFGMCTNYAVVGESALRAVVRVEGSPDPRNAGNADPHLRYPPRVVVENFNILPPD